MGSGTNGQGYDWTDWSSENRPEISRALFAAGALAGGTQQGPKQTGWGYLNYTNPATGNNNLNIYTDLFQKNTNNALMRDLGPNGYSPESVKQLWLQGLPGLNTQAANMTGDYGAALNAQAKSLINPTMEGIGSNFAGMGGLYSGAMMQSGQDAVNKLGYDAMIQQKQAQMGLLQNWSGMDYQGLQAGYGNMYNQQAAMAMPDWVAPTLAPTYGDGSFNPQTGVQEQEWWQKALSGGMTGAGIGATFGLGGALIGGALGALAGIFM